MLTMQDIRERPSLYAAAKVYRLLYVEQKEITLKAEYLLLREIKNSFPEEEWEDRIADRASNIDELFYWNETTQGFHFWERLHYISGIITGERGAAGLEDMQV